MSEMRPVYECAQDRLNQKRIAHEVAKLWGWQAIELKPLYQMDFCLVTVTQIVQALLEAKVRKKTYETYIVGLHKWNAYLSLAARARLPLLLAYELPDGIYLAKFEHDENPPYDVRIGGRFDRDDPQDIEPCVHIPARHFHTLEQWRKGLAKRR
jgi:hypothetical protein